MTFFPLWALNFERGEYGIFWLFEATTKGPENWIDEPPSLFMEIIESKSDGKKREWLIVLQRLFLYLFFLFFLVGHSVFASYYYNFMLSLYLDCYVWPSFASSPQLPFLCWIGLYLTNIHNPHASPGYLYRNPNYLFVVNCSVNNMKIRFILTTNVHKIVCPTRQIRRPFQNRSISTLST